MARKRNWTGKPVSDWPMSEIKKKGDPVPYGTKASGAANKFAEKLGKSLPDTGRDGKLLMGGGKNPKVLVMSSGQRDQRDRLVARAAKLARDIQKFETGLTVYHMNNLK